jgi:GNAT superfamily N-acetyltransferase
VTVIIEDYRSTPDLDAQIAELGYIAVLGWPDQRPLSGPMMQAYLKPTSMTATTLALHRDHDGRLLGCAALRWPATIDDAGVLWGPMVHPTARGRRLGRQLLEHINAIIAARPGVRVLTAEIPQSRAEGWALFEGLGWRAESTSCLMARPLPARLPAPTSAMARSARPGEYLDATLAALYSATRPDASNTIARDTFARWSTDSRYKPERLLLAEAADGIRGAALVLPGEHAGPGEPAEFRIVDLLTSGRLAPAQADEVRSTLVAAAMRLADESGAAIARMVAETPQIERTLLNAGFEPVEQLRHYASPAYAENSVRANQPACSKSWMMPPRRSASPDVEPGVDR